MAPDYVYCHSEIKDEFLKQLRKQIRKQFGKAPLDNKNYGKIINQKHFDRIQRLIDSSKVICGGNIRPETLQIEPTVMDKVTFEDAIMQEEIFGPVLPVLTFTSIDEVIHKVNSLAHPLALYIFAQDKAIINKVTSECGFGGGCINDVVIHLATSELPFGGFGESGMGSYHGKKGFETFSHYKSIVDKKTWMDLPIRYQPYLGDFQEAASSVSEIIKTSVQYEYKTHTAPVISSWTNKCQNLSEKVPPFLLSCNNGYFDFLLIFANCRCTAILYQNVDFIQYILR